VFDVNVDGMGFTTLYNFTVGANDENHSLTNSDGAHPQAGLVLSGNILYGTAIFGGNNGNGTVFSLLLGSVSAPQPQLTIKHSGSNVILTWPINASGFTLEFATNLASPVVWTPLPGQNTVTNSISGTRKFYRLSQ
jgi:uncharacterized repeat protein (TIGR03803 family)